jgi:hypothetical protein
MLVGACGDLDAIASETLDALTPGEATEVSE